MPGPYIIFCNEKRPTLKKGLSFGEAGKELGKMWRALSDGERAKYQAKATSGKARSGSPTKPVKKGK
jgi:hypothetical protein